MAYEARLGGSRYYYASHRVGRRVVKAYYGSGLVAEAAALLLKIRKVERAAASAQRRNAAHRPRVINFGWVWENSAGDWRQSIPGQWPTCSSRLLWPVGSESYTSTSNRRESLSSGVRRPSVCSVNRRLPRGSWTHLQTPLIGPRLRDRTRHLKNDAKHLRPPLALASGDHETLAIFFTRRPSSGAEVRESTFGPRNSKRVD